MARFLNSQKETIGLSPDAFHFRGVKKLDESRIRIIDYNSEDIKELELKSVNEAEEFNKPGSTTWLNIDGLHDTRLLEELARIFSIETLAISDILNTHSRPKIHEYDSCLLISVKMLQYDEKANKLSSENLVLLIQDHVLISFQERIGDVFNPVRERLRKNRKRIRTSGTDYLAFALIDIVIDNYIYIISRLGEKIESLDEELLTNPTTENLEQINYFKSEINFLRKSIKPCREMVLKFAKLDSDFIQEYMDVMFQELQNNIELANESLDTYREILSDQLNIFHTTVAYKLNDILKFLTIFSVIFIPITFIAGIYGTNFDNIPELHYQYSYYIMWGVILSVVIGMVTYFKRKKWF